MANYHYLHAKMKTKDLPENWTALYGKKYEIIGFSFDRNGIVEVEFCRLLTKRAADSLKAGVKSAKHGVVKAKVIRPAKSG